PTRTPCSLLASLPSSRAPSLDPSFPTRRSSDLVRSLKCVVLGDRPRLQWFLLQSRSVYQLVEVRLHHRLACVRSENPRQLAASRSEEHTSELQSRFDLVCRLLLEKKKITNDENA